MAVYLLSISALGTPTLYVPTLASDHTHVDLFRLYEVIRELGGLVAVSP